MREQHNLCPRNLLFQSLVNLRESVAKAESACLGDYVSLSL